MQTDSSASFTYLASVSASEYTTTVRMPISRQARWMRSAISPRLAIRIFSNMLAEDEERLPVLHRLAVFHKHRLHHAGGVGFDLIHQLHRLDDANRLAFLDGLADLDKGLGVGRRRTVKGTDHRSLHDVAFLACLGFGCRRRCRGGGGRASLDRRSRGKTERRRRRRGDTHRPALDDLHLLLALGDLQLRDAGFLHEVDQLFQLAQIHSFLPSGWRLSLPNVRRPSVPWRFPDFRHFSREKATFYRNKPSSTFSTSARVSAPSRR